MNLLRARLCDHEWSLLVSLPKNDPEMALAALESGAKGLKVHVNVDHFASGTHFGPFEAEREAISAICHLARQAGANVGVVPGGGGRFASPEDFKGLAATGIDYFDAYPADTPAWVFAQEDLDVMLAAYHGYAPEQFARFEKLGMTLCEASILGHEDYGKPLSALDLALYAELTSVLTVPVIVPSQKKIEPADLPVLRRTGVRGLLIGAIVTGRDVRSLAAATRSFAAG